MANAVYGRGPNGRAIRKDGTERKERRTLTPDEKLAQIEENTNKAFATIGRSLFSNAKGLEKFVSGIDIFNKWHKDAKAYGTEEARNTRRAYFQRQLDTIDAKGEAAEAWLPEADKAAAAISGLYQNIGNDIRVFVAKNKRQPNSAETEVIIRQYLTEDVVSVVENSNDPTNDVFHGFRKGEDTETVVTPSDTL